MGTAEIESATVTHPGVTESAAIGIPDATTGEALHVFVVLRNGVEPSEQLRKDLIQTIRKEVGALAVTKRLDFVPGLPKTRSGKIMRRLLKKISAGEYESLGDTSTLAEPAIVERIVEAVRAKNSR